MSAELAAAYKKGAADLRAAVAGMTREQLTARPVPGRWSTLEVVAHIADFEPVMSDRICRLIAIDDPTLMAADENDFMAKLTPDRDVSEELAVVEAIRAKTARLIAALTPEQLARTGTHSVKGPVTLEQVIRTATGHIPHHLPFIAEKRAALGA